MQGCRLPVLKYVILCYIINFTSGQRWLWPGEQTNIVTPSTSINQNPLNFRLPRQLFTNLRENRINSGGSSNLNLPLFQNQQFHTTSSQQKPPTSSSRREPFQLSQILSSQPQTFTPHPIDISKLPLETGDDILLVDFNSANQNVLFNSHTPIQRVINNAFQTTDRQFNQIAQNTNILHKDQPNGSKIGNLVRSHNSIRSQKPSFFPNTNLFTRRKHSQQASDAEISLAKALLKIPDISQLPLEISSEVVRPTITSSPPLGLPTIVDTPTSLFISPSRIRSIVDSTTNSFLITTLQPKNNIKLLTKPNLTDQSHYQNTGLTVNIRNQKPRFLQSFHSNIKSSPITSIPIQITTSDNKLLIKPATLITTSTEVRGRQDLPKLFKSQSSRNSIHKISTPPPLPESLLQLLQGDKHKTEKLKQPDKKAKSHIYFKSKETNDDDIIFIIGDEPKENHNFILKESALDMVLGLQPLDIKPDKSNSNNFSINKHKNKLTSSKDQVFNDQIKFNDIITTHPTQILTTLIPKSSFRSKKFTPSVNMASPNSFRPSAYFSPFFVSSTTFIPTRNPTNFENRIRFEGEQKSIPSTSKPFPIFKNGLSSLPSFLWVWPIEKGNKKIKISPKPSFHAL